MPYTLLLTRPAPDNARFLAALQVAGCTEMRVVLSPVLDIRPRDVAVDLTGIATLIFTSANGVAAHNNPVPMPCHVVGTRTADAARQAGHTVLSIHPNADHMLDAFRMSPPTGPVMHIRGAHARGNIAQTLETQGVHAREFIAYDQTPLPLTPEALALGSGDSPVIIPLFSPRSAAQVRSGWSGDAPIFGIALSQAVAEKAGNMNWTGLWIAAEPTQQEMVKGVIQILHRDPG